MENKTKTTRSARLLAIAVHHYQRGRVERFARWHRLHVQAAKEESRAANAADRAESLRVAELALGRILRMGARPTQPGDVAEYERCRAIVIEAAGVL